MQRMRCSCISVAMNSFEHMGQVAPERRKCTLRVWINNQTSIANHNTTQLHTGQWENCIVLHASQPASQREGA